MVKPKTFAITTVPFSPWSFGSFFRDERPAHPIFLQPELALIIPRGRLDDARRRIAPPSASPRQPLGHKAADAIERKQRPRTRPP